MMLYRGLSKDQKRFAVDVVAHIMDSKLRKCHTKRNLSRAVAAALHRCYGERVKVSTSSVDSIVNTLKVERSMVIVPEPKGRGLVLTYSPTGINATPAIIDQTESIVAAQKRAAATIQNQIVAPTFELSIRMIPASQNTLPADAEAHLRMIQDGNNNMARRLVEARKASSVRYRLVPFVEEAVEIQGGDQNQKFIEGR